MMAEEQSQEDLERLNGYLKERFNEYFAERLRDIPPQAPQAPQAPPTQTQEQLYQQQLRDVINPVVQPDISAARFEAADGKDYSHFYTGKPEHLEYHDTVEALFQEATRNGRPMPREAILNYALGKEYRADPAAFTKKQQAKHQAELDRANSAIDFGGGQVSREKAEPLVEKLRNFESLPLSEMEETLIGLGVTF